MELDGSLLLLPLAEAAAKAGLSQGRFRKRLRALGIARWPQRLLSALVRYQREDLVKRIRGGEAVDPAEVRRARNAFVRRRPDLPAAWPTRARSARRRCPRFLPSVELDASPWWETVF